MSKIGNIIKTAFFKTLVPFSGAIVILSCSGLNSEKKTYDEIKVYLINNTGKPNSFVKLSSGLEIALFPAVSNLQIDRFGSQFQIVALNRECTNGQACVVNRDYKVYPDCKFIGELRNRANTVPSAKRYIGELNCK
jgi:hypothetical protein